MEYIHFYMEHLILQQVDVVSDDCSDLIYGFNLTWSTLRHVRRMH